MTASAARLLIASVTILGFAGAASAESVTVTPAVQNACEWDYHNLGGQYAIGSDLLDICFKQIGPKLSKPCVDALIAAGDTSRKMSISRSGCSENSFVPTRRIRSGRRRSGACRRLPRAQRSRAAIGERL